MVYILNLPLLSMGMGGTKSLRAREINRVGVGGRINQVTGKTSLEASYRVKGDGRSQEPHSTTFLLLQQVLLVSLGWERGSHSPDFPAGGSYAHCPWMLLKKGSALPPPRRKAVRTQPPAPAAQSGSKWARWRFRSSGLLPLPQAAEAPLRAFAGYWDPPCRFPFCASGPSRPPPVGVRVCGTAHGSARSTQFLNIYFKKSTHFLFL